MRPLRLTLHAFGPYPAVETVDFEALAAHGLFLVHGPTGSGKSALLDAITYALFDPQKVERGGREFASILDPAAETQVVLDFELRGERYRVTRRPAQSRAKLRGVGLAQVQADGRLERLDAAGVPVEVIADKTSEVTRRVEELLGCTVEQFRQTVVLPQGEFREVVTDDKTRREVLARVFATERFAALTQRLKQRRRALESEADQHQERRRRVLEAAGVTGRDELSTRFAEAQEALEERTGERALRLEARDAANKALETGKTLAKRFEDLAELREGLRVLAAKSLEAEPERARLAAARRAARVVDRRATRDRAREAHTKAELALASATEGFESATERSQRALEAFEASEALAGEREEARDRVRTLEELAAHVGELSERRRRLTEAQARADRASESRQAAEAAAQELRARNDSLRTERDSLLPQARSLAARHEHERTAGMRLSGLRAIQEVDKSLAALAESERALERPPPELGLEEDSSLLELLERHASGLVAHNLRSGEPCPVCGSLEHPDPHPPGDLATLRALLDAQQDRAKEMTEVRTKRAAALEQRDELLAEHGWTSQEMPMLEELVEAAKRAREDRLGAEGASERVAAIEAERESITTEIDRLQRDVERATREASEATTEAQGQSAYIEATLSRLPDDARDPEAYAAALAAARERAARLVAAFEAARSELQQAREAQREAHSRVSERTAQLAASSEHLESCECDLQERLAEEGFADEASTREVEMPSAEREALASSLERLDAELADRTSRSRALEEALAGAEPPDLDSLAGASARASAMWEEADASFDAARQAHAKLREQLRELSEAERAYGDLEARLRAAARLADAADGRLRGRAKVDFETFVLQSIFAQVLAVGNDHLRRMTAGRYALHIVDDAAQASSRGLELEVADHHAGGARRPAKTLSGGEGFLAALALALGLSESARRSSGDLELGALFVDEGFGSLDELALDKVVAILRGLPLAESRMVGVISHVEELKRRIPTQLLVVPTERGSRVRLRVNE